MTTNTETNQQQTPINREISPSLKQQQQRESHPLSKHSPVDVSSEEMPPQPGAVHMIGCRVMTAEQQEEDTWDLEENDDGDDDEEQQEERPPSSEELGSVSHHSNRSNSALESANNDYEASSTVLKETYVLPPEIQAEAVDEQQEAKLLEILHAPVVQGETVSPGYARYLLPLSLTCTLLSVMGIAGMAVFVFMIRPSEVQPIPTPAPTLPPTLTGSMFPTFYAAPDLDFLFPTSDSILILEGNDNETMVPVLPPQSEMADTAPVGINLIPNGRGTLPPSPGSDKTTMGKATMAPTSLPKEGTFGLSSSESSTLAVGFISALIALSAVIAALAFAAHWQIRKKSRRLQQSKQQFATS